MPQGQVVGRISVRVLPDTSDFKAQAAKELRRIESQLKLTLGATLDPAGLRKEALEAVRDINRDNRRTDSRKVRFFTTLSTDGMGAAVKNAARELQYRANQQRVSFQVDDLKATGRIELELDQQSADKAKRKLNDWADDVSPLTVKVELDIANGTGAAMSARLQVLTRPRTVPIVPELDHGAVARVATALAALSGARVLNRMFERLSDTLKNLDKSVPIIGTLTLAIAGLAGWGLSAASNLAALSASLASIASLSLLLPGLLGGMAVGVGVMVAALKDFNKVVPGVKAALSGLQDTISENFWDKAAAPIRTMVDELLPEFTAGVAQTSTQLGGFFAGFAAGLEGALDPALKQMFDDLSASIDIATGGTEAYANIITVLGRVGTSYLPALAQWFVDISERFSSFLTKAEGDGSLKGWIDDGIQNLKDLGSVLLHLGGILAGIARAAEEAGGSSLGMLADTLQRVHSVVDSAGFQEGLIGVFKGAHAAMNAIATQSGPAVSSLFATLAQLAETILPQVGQIIGTAVAAIAGGLNQSAVTSGVQALFDGLQAAVTALAPAMAPLGVAFGALLTVVGAFAAMLGPLISAALIPLSEAFSVLAPAIIPVVNLLGGLLTAAVQAIAPLVIQLAEGLSPIISAFADGLAPIIPVVSAALQTVSAALQPLIAIFLQLLSTVLLPLLPVFQNLVASLLPPLAEAIKHVAEALAPLLSAFVALVDFLMPVLVPVLAFIAEILVTAFTQAIDGVAMILEGFVGFFKGIWDAIAGWFGMWIGVFYGIFTGDWSMFADAFDEFLNGVKQIWSGVWNIIVGAFKVVMNIGILGVAKKVLGLFKGVWKLAWGSIKTIAFELWSSLRGRWSTLLNDIKNLPNAAMTSLRQTWNSAWNDIKIACELAWGAIKKGVADSVGRVVSTVKSLPGSAKAALAAIGTTLLDAGKKLIQGLINGIKSMFGSVKSTLGGLTSKLADWKGPPKKDAILLYDAGRLIISGLIKGLESQYDKVKQSLNDLTAKIPKGASKALRARVNSDRTALLKLAAQWEGVSKRLEAARDKLDRLREEASGYAAQIAEKVIATGDVTKVEDTSFAGITASLKAAVEKAKRFAEVLKKLQSLGLNKTTIDQIASAGPEAGLAAAESIASAGKNGVAELNKLQAELAKYGNRAGKTASDALYAAGIHAAEGIVKGLESQAHKIEKQMLRIADSMVKAIKKSLGIHSPSRVFARLGSYVGIGFAKGLKSEQRRVESAVDALAYIPATRDYSAASSTLTAAVSRGIDSRSGGSSTTTKVLNYYAAQGNSLSSEEALFKAAGRARMVGW
ncbi:phage tail protein [Streptomyces sp. DT117]|uniref:phage tail protein n=1 Tax=Streptomyces sp. DT117 TaxID=3393422 RepID=UPI003CF99308